MISVDFIDDRKGWAVGKNYVLFTKDGGKQWLEKLEYQDITFTAIQFLDTINGWIVGTNGTLLKTNNGGETWEYKFTGVSTTLYDVHFVDSLNGWISGKNATLLATTDGGNNWKQQNILGNYTFQKIQFVNRSNGWVSAGDEIAFFRTTNGGATWNHVFLSNYIFDGIHSFFFVDKNIGFSSSFFYSDILITYNGGLSWTVEERLPTTRINSLQFKAPHLGWGVGFNGTILRYFNPDSVDNILLGKNIAGSFPNPFSYFTTIYFNLSYDQLVTITIFDLLGKKIKTLSKGLYNKGTNTISWEPSGLASGIYLVSIQCQEYLKTIKCVLLK